MGGILLYIGAVATDGTVYCFIISQDLHGFNLKPRR